MKIEYCSTDEFESSYRAEIYQESEQLIQDHLWWNEPLTLFDRIEYPLHLTGESDLVRDFLYDDYGPKREIKRRDDVYLALVDYIKLVDVLEQLSAEHEIQWKLFYKNSSGKEVVIGYINAGVSDPSVLEFITDTLGRYKIEYDMLWDADRINEVYSTYFDENDDPIY